MAVTLPRNVAGLGAGALAVAPQALAATGAVNGPVIDRRNHLSAVLLGITGAATGSPSGISTTFKLQHGDASDGSDMADFDDNSPRGTASNKTATAENALALLGLDLSGAKRYVRVVATNALTGGTTPTLQVGAGLFMGGSAELPA